MLDATLSNGELAGKVALVVGGSSGIGYSAALLMARRGARVAILADRGVQEALDLAASDAVTLMGISGDASRSEVVKAAIAQIIEAYGAIHITVHTAAIHPYGNAGDTSEATWDQVMAVNLKSVYLLAHWVLPHMLRQGDGAIINVSSVQGSANQREVSAYATSKAAILGFTRTLAVDYTEKGIRALSVSPGSIRTPLLDLSVTKFGNGRSKQEVFESWGQATPAKRIGEPHEVAEVIAFAASPRASYCSGSELVVDGGLSVQL